MTLKRFLRMMFVFVVLFDSIQFGQNLKYPAIVSNSLIFYGDKCSWDANAVHTFSIVEANKDGYKYWAYYGLDHYHAKDSHVKKSGLARSNDLINWEKYEHNPIINNNCRWPTVIYQYDTFYMFYAEYNNEGFSRIVMVSSKNGLDFENKTVIVPYVKGEHNQNPFIYFDENDRNFYLFYYHGTKIDLTQKIWNIVVRKSKNILELKNKKSRLIVSSKTVIAAPSVTFYEGKYYLLVEEFGKINDEIKWVTNAFYSDEVDKGYKRVTNNPILSNNDACAFQYIFNNNLYVTYSHGVNRAKSIWNLRMIKVK